MKDSSVALHTGLNSNELQVVSINDNFVPFCKNKPPLVVEMFYYRLCLRKL